jgi:hypothetical protein
VKLKYLCAVTATAFCLSSHAGPFDALFGGNKSGSATTESAKPAIEQPNIDLTKVFTQPMTARQLFEQQGMYSTLNLAAQMQADAKANKNGMFADALGTITMDTGAMLRLAARLTASFLSFTALEKLMNSFSDHKNIMDGISVDVPQIAALSPQLQGDVMGVARFLVAMKASNALVQESEKSLESAKERYHKLMAERDEKAASLGKANFLVNGVFQLNEAELKGVDAQDLEALKPFYGKPLEDVLKNTQATHLLDRELRARYPGEYVSILDGEKEVASHYSEFAKTSVGTLSMLGFASVFIKNVVDMGAQSDFHKVLLVPMAKDGVVELVGIVKNVVSALSRNDDLVEGTFSITTKGKTTGGVAASKVLKSLPEEQLNAFRGNLIGAQDASYVSRLDTRAPTFAADILDRLVDRDIKEDVAKTSLSVENPDTFSFKTAFAADNNAFASKGVDPVRLKKRFYEENLEGATDEKDVPIGKLQAQVKKDVTKITNQDLRRIMMLGKSTESLVVGDSIIRMEQPGLQGLADQQELRAMTLAQATQDVKSQKIPESKEAPAAPSAEPAPTPTPAPGKKGTGSKSNKGKAKA